MNKVFYFNNNKGTRKDKKILPIYVQANKRKYKKPFKSISWSDSKTLD